MADQRDYDIVVFGSTGYTGQFVAEELKRLQGEGRRSFKWAAAGRKENKVRECLRVSGIEDVDVLIADVSDQSSIDTMCSKATVIINCVGPYQLYGEPVVKACVAQKCNYVDITGEPYFMEDMIARYDEQAREAGVYIVFSCGFGSIPNDMGALLLQRTFNGELAYIESYMTAHNGGSLHTGTWESLLRMIRCQSKLKALRKQRNLPPLILPPVKPPRRILFYSDVIQKWCVSAQELDETALNRSRRYRQTVEGINPFGFFPYVALDYLGLKSPWQAILLAMFFIVVLLMAMTDFGLKLLLKYPRFFSAGIVKSNGPTREELERTTFTVALVGSGYSTGADKSKPPDSKLTVKIRGIDPAYGATSAMLVQAALCFVEEKDALPPSGGMYTPSVAFGNTKLIQNLENTGKVKFEVIPK